MRSDKSAEPQLKYLFIVYLSLAVLHPLRAAPGDFSEKEKTVIYTFSLNLVKDYQRLINEIGEYAVNNLEAAQSSSEAFMELFVNRQVLIYNDLDPSHQLSPFYEAETYISNLLLWYPDGMDIEMDFENARVGNILQHENDIYSLDILLTKQIDGNYLNRMQNRNTEDLLFRVAFNRKSGGNYKIVGIRDSKAGYEIDLASAIQEVNSEELKVNEQIQVEDGVRALLNDYTNLLTLLADPQEPGQDKVFYRESFTSLFEGASCKVFNDLVPDPQNYLLSTEEYLALLGTGYSGGINNLSLNIDSAKVGNVLKNEDESYHTVVNVDKFFSGVYQGDRVFRDMFPLTVAVRFERSGNAFTNFRIQGIDLKAEDFYQASVATSTFQLPDMQITTITRKGFSLEFLGGYGYSPVVSQTINTISIDYDAHEWEVSPGYGYRAGIHASYFFNDHFAITSGLSYNNYTGNFHLEGLFTDIELSRDVNDDSYFKIIDAKYDSSVSVSFIDLPLLFGYYSGSPGKFGVYVELGGSAGYRVSSAYLASGDYKFYGYYPYHPTVTQYLYIEELGYYDQKNINRDGEVEVASFNLSGYASAGITIPLGYFSYFKLGPEICYGFSDINPVAEYRDIFGKVRPPEPTILKKYGAKFSYVLKL